MTDEHAPTASTDDAPHPPGELAAVPPQEPAEAPPAAAAVGPVPPAAPPAVDTVVGTPPKPRPNYLFLGAVSIITLALDLGSKAWAKARLDDAARSFADRRISVVQDTFSFMFARNRGGAWGLLQDEPESIRRPFFLGISALAIGFIVSLYRKLTPSQWALKWGLPLVLGGALGNLINRVQYNYVVDFIDIRAGWVRKVNGFISDNPTDHWPTFNVADVAIVAGVILMAVDMFTPRKPPPLPALAAAPAVVPDAPPEAISEAIPEGPVAPVITEPAAPKET